MWIGDERDLSNIKTGDSVAISDNTRIVRAIVTRTTKTSIIVGGSRYSRKTGRQYDNDSGNPYYISPLTEAVKKTIDEAQIKRNRRILIDNIRNADFDEVPTEILKQIKDLIISSTRR